MNTKNFTKDDVRNVYRFILGREPEDEAVIERHFNSFSKLSDFLYAIYISPEYKNKIKIAQNSTPEIIIDNNEETVTLVKIDEKTFEMRGDNYLKLHIKNEFEPKMVHLSKSLINTTDNVLDIGANIGCTSLLFGLLGNRVVSFEPNPSTFDFLKRNILNSGLINIDVQNIGLGASAGVFEMAFSENNRSGAFINDYQQAASAHEKTKVRIERLDDIVGNFNLFKIDLLPKKWTQRRDGFSIRTSSKMGGVQWQGKKEKRSNLTGSLRFQQSRWSRKAATRPQRWPGAWELMQTGFISGRSSLATAGIKPL